MARAEQSTSTMMNLAEIDTRGKYHDPHHRMRRRRRKKLAGDRRSCEGSFKRLQERCDVMATAHTGSRDNPTLA